MRRPRRFELGAWLFAVSLAAWFFWAVDPQEREETLLAVGVAVVICGVVGFAFADFILAADKVNAQPRPCVVSGRPRLRIVNANTGRYLMGDGEWYPRPVVVRRRVSERAH